MPADLVTYLGRLAAARGGTATVILVTPLGDIPCRDEQQAQLLERLYHAFMLHCDVPDRTRQDFGPRLIR